MALTGLKPAPVTAPANIAPPPTPARRRGECRSRKARAERGASLPLSDGGPMTGPPGGGVQGRGSGAAGGRPGPGSCPPRPGRAHPPVPEPGWRGGAAPSPVPRGRAGVSKVTARVRGSGCFGRRSALSAGIRLQPSGGALRSPRSTPDTRRDRSPEGRRRLPSRPFLGAAPSRRLEPRTSGGTCGTAQPCPPTPPRGPGLRSKGD